MLTKKELPRFNKWIEENASLKKEKPVRFTVLLEREIHRKARELGISIHECMRFAVIKAIYEVEKTKK